MDVHPDDESTQPAQPQPEALSPTRTGRAWISICVATIVGLALIVFLAQNTRKTDVTFLWMTATTSLAIALLIAAVAGALLAVVIGSARIVQLRRASRRRQRTLTDAFESSRDTTRPDDQR